METIERRAPWLAVSIAILLIYDAGGAGLYNGLSTWQLIVFLAGLISLGLAAVLLVLSLAPAWFRPFSTDQRERFVFFAVLLVSLTVVAVVILSSYAAIHAHNHANS